MLIISVASFIFGVVVWGTISELVQEWFKQRLFDKNTTIKIQHVRSSVGVFSDDNCEGVFQIMHYVVSVSNLTKKIKIRVIFPQGTEVKYIYVKYSVDIKGFDCTRHQKNYVVIELTHPLDSETVAHVFLCTQRNFQSDEYKKLEFPNIHVEGKPARKTVYQLGNL